MGGPDRPRPYQLVAFDVDGTLIGNDGGQVVWQLFNERFSAADAEVERRVERFMAGEISYEQWVELDVRDWIAWGATREQLAAVVRQELRVLPGARETLEQLAADGYRLAVISGTLDLTLDELLGGQPFDVVYTNRIHFDASGLIVGWEATPYDMEGKAVALRRIARELSIPLSQAVYVGDNLNDVAAMSVAGLAIAFEPKAPAVRDAAHAVIEGDMRLLLDLLDR